MPSHSTDGRALIILNYKAVGSSTSCSIHLQVHVISEIIFPADLLTGANTRN